MCGGRLCGLESSPERGPRARTTGQGGSPSWFQSGPPNMGMWFDESRFRDRWPWSEPITPARGASLCGDMRKGLNPTALLRPLCGHSAQSKRIFHNRSAGVRRARCLVPMTITQIKPWKVLGRQFKTVQRSWLENRFRGDGGLPQGGSRLRVALGERWLGNCIWEPQRSIATRQRVIRSLSALFQPLEY